jgi:hypothetical protein
MPVAMPHDEVSIALPPATGTIAPLANLPLRIGTSPSIDVETAPLRAVAVEIRSFYLCGRPAAVSTTASIGFCRRGH